MIAPKRDNNHRAIVQALRKIGCSVADTASMGKGFPDLVVGYRGKTFLVEVKNETTGYGKRGLNPLQKQFREKWLGSKIIIACDVEQIIKQIQGEQNESE